MIKKLKFGIRIPVNKYKIYKDILLKYPMSIFQLMEIQLHLVHMMIKQSEHGISKLVNNWPILKDIKVILDVLVSIQLGSIYLVVLEINQSKFGMSKLLLKFKT